MNGLIAQEKLRKAVIKYKQNHTIVETAKFFEIGEDTVSRWDSQYKKEGRLLPRETGGLRHYVVSEEGKKFIVSLIEENNDMTLEEIRQAYFIQFNENISIPTVSYHLKKLNITHKKKFLRSQ
jgi:transposase